MKSLQKTPNRQNRILVHPFFQTTKIIIQQQKQPPSIRNKIKPTLEEILYAMRKTQQPKQISPIKYHARQWTNKIFQTSKKSPQVTELDSVKIGKKIFQVSSPKSNIIDLRNSLSTENRVKVKFRSSSIRKNAKIKKYDEIKIDPSQLMKPCIISAMPIKSRPLTSGEKYRPIKLENQEENSTKNLYKRKVKMNMSMQQQLLLPLSPWISEFAD